MFINIIIYLVLVIAPYIPLFMGFREKYLEFFEQYLAVLQSHNSLPGKTLFYVLMLLLSPYTISRPYLAWLSSVSYTHLDVYKRQGLVKFLLNPLVKLYRRITRPKTMEVEHLSLIHI